jgi:hypothetical protein
MTSKLDVRTTNDTIPSIRDALLKLEQHLNELHVCYFLPKEASLYCLSNSDALQVRLLLYSFLLLHRKGILQCSSKVGSG